MCELYIERDIKKIRGYFIKKKSNSHTKERIFLLGKVQITSLLLKNTCNIYTQSRRYFLLDDSWKHGCYGAD